MAAILTAQNENPGALAGATGADIRDKTTMCEVYRKRLESATALCRAIAACEPEDAAFLMNGILERMCAGSPTPVFLSAMDDARWWVSIATHAEVKAWALACYEQMPAATRAAFLGHVGGMTA